MNNLPICVGGNGKVWTAIGIDHKPIAGYRQFFAYTYQNAMKTFIKEYGNDSAILYLRGDKEA
jgi:hypothetical protein